MAEKQDEERFLEEAELWLKEMKLAGVHVHTPMFGAPVGPSGHRGWVRLVYGGHSLVLQYRGYVWYAGAPGYGQAYGSFEEAKEDVMQRLGFRE